MQILGQVYGVLHLDNTFLLECDCLKVTIERGHNSMQDSPLTHFECIVALISWMLPISVLHVYYNMRVIMSLPTIEGLVCVMCAMLLSATAQM